MSAWATLQDVLAERASAKRPGRLLLYTPGSTWSPAEITYTTLHEEARQNSRVIRSLVRFKAGHPVLLHFDNHWDTILWFWSVLFAGGLPVLSSPLSNVEEDRRRHIRALSATLESPVCLTRARLLHLFGKGDELHLYPVEHLLEKFEPESGHAQVRNGGHVQKFPWDMKTSELMRNGMPALCDREGYGMGADLLMLMLTSGSTGDAKAVQFTHGQILAAVSGKAAVRPLPSNQPLLNWIGLDHVAGLIEIHFQALWLGVDQVHVSAADVVPSPVTFLDLLSRHRVSRTFAPNFFLGRLVSAMGSARPDSTWDLSGLIQVASGGEPNDVRTCVTASALFERYGAPHNVITPGFGMTETCAGAIFNLSCPDRDVAEDRVVASLGKCMAGLEMRVIAAAGEPQGIAAPDMPGDLEVRGPVVFRGYYRNNAATAQAFTPDGWFRTGDQAAIDADGNLRLAGRAKDVININGVKMPAGDIQMAVEQAVGDRVVRLVVFPSASEHTERVTVAYVPRAFPVPGEDAVDIARLATQACLMSTATLPLIFALQEHSVPLLPTSSLGKISRLRTARLFDDGELALDVKLHEQAMRHAARTAGQAGWCTSEPTTETEARLIDDVAETLDSTPGVLGLGPDTCVFDIGFTSMHVIRLRNRLERRLGVDIPIIRIMKNPTIRFLAANLEARAPDPGAATPDEVPAGSYDPVVVLREGGTRNPLWLVHPGVGEVLVFVGLARCLAAEDRPVFALRAAGFEPGQRRFASIGEAVDVYTAAIRGRQPRGPYALAGYSYGTMLAFEAAKRLTAAGDEVRFLGSFNLPPHIKSRIRQLGWNACLLHLSHFLGLVTEDVSDAMEADAAFAALPRAAAMDGVLAVSDRARLDELGLDEPALARWADVAFGLQSMAADYDPSGVVDNIDVFHAVPLRAAAASRAEWLRDHLSRWADFVREPPRFHAVQGAHYTMIGPEYVRSFAGTLVGALKARGV